MKNISFLLSFLFCISVCCGQIATVKTGLWSDPAVWSSNTIPTGNDDVFITFDIIVDIDAACKSLSLNGSHVTVNSGVKLSVATDIPLINCDGLITDTLGTNDNAKIYMPSAFTPNGDGVNDLVRPITINIMSLTFTIYDATNSIVFTTGQVGESWQAPVNNNTFIKYYYKIQAITTNNRKIGLCGALYDLACFPADVPIQSFYFEDQLTQNGFTGLTSENLSQCQ